MYPPYNCRPAPAATCQSRQPTRRSDTMLFDPARHEPLLHLEWDPEAASSMIERIVRTTERAFAGDSGWPLHPLDASPDDRDPVFNLYFGAGGVAWALHYLQAVGAVTLERSYADCIDGFVARNAAWLRSSGMQARDRASYLMGDTGLLLVDFTLRASPRSAEQLEQLISGNLDHPARELMWGAPGTMLASLFMHERTGEARWGELYRVSARALQAQLQWSATHECRHWTQELYGQTTAYLDAVHGFVATAAAIIQGRHLFEPEEWIRWQQYIVETVANTALCEGGRANWPALLYETKAQTRAQKTLMQFCHGAPGFVICLAALPARELDDLLIAGGEAAWDAGPLTKGSNLCHGTGGNGYAFLRLYERTHDERWLARARAFAMHGIAQTEAHTRHHGRMRYSLWTGDPGFAVYLWHCVRGKGGFPTLDFFRMDGGH